MIRKILLTLSALLLTGSLAHATCGPDDRLVMSVSGLVCKSSDHSVPQTRHFGVYTKAPKSWSMSGGHAPWLSQAEQYVNRGNPTTRRTLWCARFINDRLRQTGLRGTNSDMADSFMVFPRTSARPGAIAVYSRGGRGGHVAIVKHVDGDVVTLVSGNCGRMGVCEYTRKLGQARAYVWPS